MPDDAPIISHKQIWNAIDTLASRSNLSSSGLARLAGLDPTAFNKSKRATAGGRKRWPSTESIAKVLAATNTRFDEFANLMSSSHIESNTDLRPVPVVGVANNGEIQFYNEPGFTGLTLDVIDGPAEFSASAYGIAVGDNTMAPVYRTGDVLIVARDALARTGDRVVVKTDMGVAVALTLQETNDGLLGLAPIAWRQRERQINPDRVLWMDRIIWASQ